MFDGILSILTNKELSPRSFTLNDIYLYAHNGGKFDITVILAAFTKVHYECTNQMPEMVMSSKNEFFQVSVKYGNFTFNLRDSMKIILGSVDSISKTMLNSSEEKLVIS